MLSRPKPLYGGPCGKVIAVYDGSQEGGTHMTITYARKKGVPVELIAPQTLR